MRRNAMLSAVLAVTAHALAGSPARAQEDEAAESAQASRRHGDEPAEARPARFSFDYDLGLFGGMYVQDGALGPLVDAGGRAQLDTGGHRLRLGATYLYDPFSMKVFNFSDDATEDSSGRLAQSLHEVGGELEWRSDWQDGLSTKFQAETGYRWPEQSADERWALDLRGDVAIGADWPQRGPFVGLSGAYFRRIYPSYRVAERSLDQQGAEGGVTPGYSFGHAAQLELGYALRLTDYLDARYDALQPDGELTRAGESKSYLRHELHAEAITRPIRPVRLGLRYTYQRNNSRHYDREMTGRNEAGVLEPFFIRDYYDYDRHGALVSFRWDTPIGLRVELSAEYWIRLFETYEARDAGNRWLGETRIDHDFEANLETSYEVCEVAGQSFNLTGFVSHVTGRSNMEREISFATNYDVTRVFLGIEIHD